MLSARSATGITTITHSLLVAQFQHFQRERERERANPLILISTLSYIIMARQPCYAFGSSIGIFIIHKYIHFVLKFSFAGIAELMSNLT